MGVAHFIKDCFEVLGALDDAPDDASTSSSLALAASSASSIHPFTHSLNHMLNFILSSLPLSSNKQESMAPPTVCIILTSLLHEGLGVVLRVHMCP